MAANLNVIHEGLIIAALSIEADEANGGTIKGPIHGAEKRLVRHREAVTIRPERTKNEQTRMLGSARNAQHT